MSGPHVVIPVKDNPAMTGWVLGQLEAQGEASKIIVIDNGSGPEMRRWLAQRSGRGAIWVIDAPGTSLAHMWRLGATAATTWDGDGHVAFLNNDVSIGPRFLSTLSQALEDDDALWAVSPNYDGRPIDGVEYVTSTFRRGGMAGFAFMIRRAVFGRIAFDQQFEWWYADDDLVAQIESGGGKIGIAGGASVEHLGGGSQTVRYTPEVLETIERDRARMIAKWGHD
jgi:GT2 family glycosyltransferase